MPCKQLDLFYSFLTENPPVEERSHPEPTPPIMKEKSNPIVNLVNSNPENHEESKIRKPATVQQKFLEVEQQ